MGLSSQLTIQASRCFTHRAEEDSDSLSFRRWEQRELWNYGILRLSGDGHTKSVDIVRLSGDGNAKNSDILHLSGYGHAKIFQAMAACEWGARNEEHQNRPEIISILLRTAQRTPGMGEDGRWTPGKTEEENEPSPPAKPKKGKKKRPVHVDVTAWSHLFLMILNDWRDCGGLYSTVQKLIPESNFSWFIRVLVPKV